MSTRNHWQPKVAWLNPLLSRTPKRLFEICDLQYTPKVICAQCQATLTKEWTSFVPWLQTTSPAEIASLIILNALQAANNETREMSIVDFCSGAGGPVPTIERIVNDKRRVSGQKKIPFLMTDLKPHIQAWKEAAAQSNHLDFISRSVDATNPGELRGANAKIQNLKPTKTIRLFCLAFHHFDDQLATEIMKSTFNSGDTIIIIELQDRRLFSFILMMLNFFYLFLISPIWFWNDPAHLALTYFLPILPVVVVFDGIISSLRTREPNELLSLADHALGQEVVDDSRELSVNQDNDFYGQHKFVKRGSWRFTCGRKLHTYPFGYMNWFVADKS